MPLTTGNLRLIFLTTCATTFRTLRGFLLPGQYSIIFTVRP